jgi:hypothetical protein
MKLKMPLFFVVLVVSCILLAGCISALQPAPVTPTSPAPVENTPVMTLEQTLPPVTTAPQSGFTRDQVSQLFIDIAFGCDNTWIIKIMPTAENHLFYSLEGQVTDEDRNFVDEFARNYNLITSTETFTGEPLSTKGDSIILYPPDSMKSLEQAFVGCQDLDPETGAVLLMIYNPVVTYPSGEQVVTTRIYINSDLTGQERQHYLERAMLYYLGFPGETYTYPDSVFYYKTQENVEFTPLDIEAMKTMHNPGIYPGMSVTEARYYLLDNR